MIEIKFEINNSMFNKDPQQTDLGKKILEHSVLMIDEIGFEAFTFKKLAQRIGSAEKSIYRYFDNKHLLLLFLTSWYWEWVHYLISINIINITDPKRKLEIAISNLVKATSENPMTRYINENVLHKVVIKEGGKAYHIKDIDEENKAGLFLSYNTLVKLVAEIIQEINPDFKYCTSLASNLFEMSNNQIYFTEHLPQLSSLSNCAELNQNLIDMLNLYTEKLLVEG
ncbi:MAG: TetR/AcrR family transcriptional regulator [Bacteroidota bacterium]